MTERSQSPDDPSSAPESGTDRDDTSGNNPAKDQSTQFTRQDDAKASTTDPKNATTKSGRDTKPAQP